MAKKTRKPTKQEANKDKTESAAENNPPAPAEDGEEEPVVDENKAEPPKKAAKRGSAAAKDEASPAKKKKGKLEENGVASTRPQRATATKAAKEVKSMLTPKKKVTKKATTKKTPSPKKEPSQFEVESIIDSRKRKGRTEFKIRWKGYTASADTWEPARNLNCPELLEAWKADKEKAKAE